MKRPTPRGPQALLKVLQVGIDGTDIEINDGMYGEPPTGSNQLILGHECLAIVEETPAESNTIAKGDLVVPAVRRPDTCINCVNGEPDMCLTGNYKEHGIKGLHGFASEYSVSDSDYLIKVPRELEDIGVLVEPMSVVEKGVFQTFKVQERMVWRPDRVLVLGAGPLGLLTTFLLRLKGLEVHTVARGGKESLKASLVERAGAKYVSTQDDSISNLGRFDMIFEVTGVPSVGLEAQGQLNNNGVMCFLGIYRSKEVCPDIGRLYTDLVLGNRTFFGSVNANRRDYESGLKDLMEVEHRFPGVLGDMMTNVVLPADYMKALNPRKDDIKSVIDFKSLEA